MSVPFNPVTESVYVAGNVTVTSTTTSLWSLIQSEIDQNAGGAPYQMILVADPGNTGDILIGGPATSATVWGYNLSPGVSRNYTAGNRNGIIPLSRIFVYSAASNILHVEMYP